MAPSISDISPIDVSTQEVLLRTHDLVQIPRGVTRHLIDVSSIAQRLSHQETRKEERRIVQMRIARQKSAKQRQTAAKDSGAEDAVPAQASSERREAEETDADDTSETIQLGRKKRKVNGDCGTRFPDRIGDSAAPSGVPSPSIDHATPTEAVTHGDAQIMLSEMPRPLSTASHSPVPRSEPISGLSSVVLTKPAPEMRGHTSYLTFAAFHPATIRQQLAVQEVSKRGNGNVVQRGESVETEFGSEGMDQVMGTVTEEEMVALAAKTK